VLSQIQNQFGYYVFLLAYLFGFILLAYLILLTAIAIKKWHKQTKKLPKSFKAN